MPRSMEQRTVAEKLAYCSGKERLERWDECVRNITQYGKEVRARMIMSISAWLHSAGIESADL